MNAAAASHPVSPSPESGPEIVFVLSKQGSKLHRAYAMGGPTFCGVRLRTGRRVISPDSLRVHLPRCEKCFGGAK